MFDMNDAIGRGSVEAASVVPASDGSPSNGSDIYLYDDSSMSDGSLYASDQENHSFPRKRSNSYAQEEVQVEVTDAGNKRYFVQGNVKQPIFGSKKYNPVIQQFECTNDARTTKKPISPLDGSPIETTSEPEAGSTAWPGISSPETPWPGISSSESPLPGILETDTESPGIASTEEPVTGTPESLRGQHKVTKVWWQQPKTNIIPIPQNQQKKGGKKKQSRRDDAQILVQPNNSSLQKINEIN